MNRDLGAEGRRLIAEAEAILRRDAAGAMGDGDFNLAVRRSQEVVELTLKGGLRLLGLDYPREHDAGQLFCEELRTRMGVADAKVLSRLAAASLWLAQARAPAFYHEKEYGAEDARQAVEDAKFVMRAVRRVLAGTR